MAENIDCILAEWTMVYFVSTVLLKSLPFSNSNNRSILRCIWKIYEEWVQRTILKFTLVKSYMYFYAHHEEPFLDF